MAKSNEGGLTKLFKAAMALVGLYVVIMFAAGVINKGSEQREQFAEEEQAHQAKWIQHVLDRDRQISQAATDHVNKGNALLPTLQWMVGEMEKIEITGCPPEFAEAYVRHRAAWRQLQMVVESEPQTPADGVLMGLINGLGGELDGGMSRFAQARQQAYANVADTWTEVEVNAVRYGVQAPAN